MNNQYDNEKMINYGIFSPKIEKSRHLKLNKNKKNLGNYITFSKYTTSISGSPMSLYSEQKNNNKYNLPDYSRVSRIVSPLHRNNSSKFHKSSSQKNISSRPLSTRSRILPSVINNNSLIKSPTNKNKSINSSVIYSNENENFSKKQNFFNLETEKLYQETFQIKKLVRILSKELSSLKKENKEKDKQISIKEKQINDIILNNNISNFENTGNNNNNKSRNSNDQSFNSNLNNNNKSKINNDNSSILNDSIYANALTSNRNSSTSNLFFKIKKEIKQTNNNIKKENDKFKKLKKSLFVTKMNELNLESNILELQVNKINSLLSNALKIKEKNEIKTNELENIKENLEKQDTIINNLITFNINLEKEEKTLKNTFNKNKKELKSKIKKVNLNNSKIGFLKKKNEKLTNNKVIKDQTYTTMINGNPIDVNSLYTNKIIKLKKSINLYKTQIKHSDNEIKLLQDKKNKIIEAEKIRGLKFNSNFIDKNNKNINMNITINKNNISNVSDLSNKKSKFNISEDEIISKLRQKLHDSKEEEKKLQEKVALYQNKLKEIDVVQEGEKEEGNQSQIEFGIDNDNPFYIEDEDNLPEIKNKFTSSQFNQFTYILFKNFESKGIVLEESKNKIIDPLIEFANKNNLSVVEYPSNNFDFIVEEFTKIIMNVLNSNNSYNFILTKIFISALFYNSECNINKLIEYFNILFNYTRNYSLEEEKYINKLKTKYRKQSEKLVSCINKYIHNELNSSEYFPLLKMKELLDQNEINLKDKYIEFLFYYMKKFDDPNAKLGDLKFSLLYNIIPLSEFDNNINLNIRRGNNEINSNTNKNEEKTNVGNLSEEDNPQKNFENTNNKDDSNVLPDMDKSNQNNKSKSKKDGLKTPTEVEFSKRQKKKNNTDKNDNNNNSDDYEEDEDSMTEITNEEYIKQLTEAICLMQKGLKEANTNFGDLMTNVIQKRKINGIFYECITIEDFNDQLKSINVVLSDLKLSCLCSKYSIPNELRLIDKNKIEKDIEDQMKGTLKLEEEEEDN